ncbi:MFS transporter [Salidesulfovibrio brasiliensis]|uniref:MFS transporter n=1 Tax=Salidesulfovibrio brasiliensis TaxID=221711 RepID=UPI0006CF8D19|nr:MFS transporter [Salidesulfovibrio brasiliensis]
MNPKEFIFNKNTEQWYLGYAFQGAVVLGIAPILIPVIVGNAAGNAAAGVVVAAFYAGQLLSPLLGGVADRTGKLRAVWTFGYAVLALCLALFGTTSNLAFWMILCFMQGMGAAACNTVAAMFIVEFKPKGEWDDRIGWLQTFYGAGQALGLGLAAALQASPAIGMLVSGLLMIPGWWLGRIGLPKDSDRTPSTSEDKARGGSAPRQPVPHIHHRLGSLERFLHVLTRLKSQYGTFIFSWFLSMLSMWLIFNLYPLLMKQTYGIGAFASSLYYAAGAFIGIFAYAPSGALGRKIGNGPVVLLSYLMVIISVAGMAVLAVTESAQSVWLAPVFFLLTPIAWSPAIVAGTAYVAELATFEEGSAIGMFNATTAIGSVLAALGAGAIADSLGFTSVLILSGILGALAIVPLFRVMLERRGQRHAEVSPEKA